MRALTILSLLVGCSRPAVTEQVGPEPLPVPFGPSATVAPPIGADAKVSVDAIVPELTDAQAKWLETIAHAPLLPWEHTVEDDLALTLTKIFLAPGATTSDPVSMRVAGEVDASSLATGVLAPGCGQTWIDVHLRAASPKARASSHELLAKVAAGATATAWSNGVYHGERVHLKRTAPWDDGGLFGVLYRGDEIVFVRGWEFQSGDADCPSLEETWSRVLKR